MPGSQKRPADFTDHEVQSDGPATSRSEGTSALIPCSQTATTSTAPHPSGFPHRGCTGYQEYQSFLDKLRGLHRSEARLLSALEALGHVPEDTEVLSTAPTDYRKAVHGFAVASLLTMRDFTYHHERYLKPSTNHCPLMPFPAGLATKDYSENECCTKVYYMVRGSKIIDAPEVDCEECSDLEVGGDELMCVGQALQTGAETILDEVLSAIDTVVNRVKELSSHRRSHVGQVMRVGMSQLYQKTYATAWDESQPELSKQTKKATTAMEGYIGEDAALKYVEWLDKLKEKEAKSWKWCFEVAEMGRPMCTATDAAPVMQPALGI